MNYKCNDSALPKLTLSNYVGLQKPHNSIIFIHRKFFKDAQKNAVKNISFKKEIDDKNLEEENIQFESNTAKGELSNDDEILNETIKFAKAVTPLIFNSPKNKYKLPRKKLNKNATVKFTDLKIKCNEQKCKRRDWNNKRISVRRETETCEIGTQYEVNFGTENDESKEETLNTFKKKLQNLPIHKCDDTIEDEDTLYELNSYSSHSHSFEFMKGDSDGFIGKGRKQESEDKSMKVKRKQLIEMLGTVLKTEENDTEIKFTVMNHGEKKQFTDEISSFIVQALKSQIKVVADSNITEFPTICKTFNEKQSKKPNISLENEQSTSYFQGPSRLQTDASYTEPLLVKSVRSKTKTANKQSAHNVNGLEVFTKRNDNDNKVKNMANEMNDDKVLDYFQKLHDNNCEDVQVENFDDDQNALPSQQNISDNYDQVCCQSREAYAPIKRNTSYCNTNQENGFKKPRVANISSNDNPCAGRGSEPCAPNCDSKCSREQVPEIPTRSISVLESDSRPTTSLTSKAKFVMRPHSAPQTFKRPASSGSAATTSSGRRVSEAEKVMGVMEPSNHSALSKMS